MSAAPPTLEVTHTSSVTPDQIDEIGHMNVRYYGMNALAATQTFCERLGIGSPDLTSTYTRHHHEQMEGNQLEVRSALVDGGDTLRFYHELRNRVDDDLAATFVHQLDHPRLEAPTIELPDVGRPRSLRLDTDGLASAPSIDELHARDLAVRLPRTVDAEDTEGADQVPTWLANNLIWGGERPDELTDWIRTLPNGDRYAFVVMESRLWVRPEPVRIGTPIQSFSATVEIAEKITRDVSWSYDTSTGEPIAVIESIDLCFNMSERRSMPIPAESRERHLVGYHPEFSPT